MSSGPEKMAMFLDRVLIWLLLWMTGFNFHLWIAQRTVFTDRDFWKRSWAHAVMSSWEWCLFLMQGCLRAWSSRASSAIFTSERLCLAEMLLLYRHVTDLLSVNLISGQILHLIFTSYFSNVLLLLFQSFGNTLLPLKSKRLIFSMNW